MNWIKVSDSLPESNVPVLIYPNTYIESEWSDYSQTGKDIYWAMVFYKSEKFYAYDFKDDCYCEMKQQPTHWMPLPKPPIEL